MAGRRAGGRGVRWGGLGAGWRRKSLRPTKIESLTRLARAGSVHTASLLRSASSPYIVGVLTPMILAISGTGSPLARIRSATCSVGTGTVDTPVHPIGETGDRLLDAAVKGGDLGAHAVDVVQHHPQHHRVMVGE